MDQAEFLTIAHALGVDTRKKELEIYRNGFNVRDETPVMNGLHAKGFMAPGRMIGGVCRWYVTEDGIEQFKKMWNEQKEEEEADPEARKE